MRIEKILLEINTKYKFNLKLGEAVQLQDMLREVGRITNFYFLLQEEYYRKYGDKNKLKEYHERLKNDDIYLKVTNVMNLIDGIYERLNDEEDKELKEVIEKTKFWGNGED